jgi:ABC-type polysaccharide/polyol phosphate export permease
MSRSKETKILRDEFCGTLDRLDLAIYIAWSDTLTRYRRSALGPFWLVLGTLISVGGLSLVWGALFEVELETFIPSVCIGLVVWYLLSGTLIEGASGFYAQRTLLLNIHVSSLFVSTTLLFRQLVNFWHNFVVIVIVIVIFPQNFKIEVFPIFFVGLFLVSVCLLGVIHLVGYLGARFRDLSPLISAVVQPLFFITPVLFRPDQLGTAEFVAALNPLTHLLRVIRDPLMGEIPPVSTWLVVVGLTVVSCTLASLMTISKRQRLAYWVN